MCFINGGKSSVQVSNIIENTNTIDQIQKFKSSIRLSHIEKPLREPMEKILLYYMDVFNLDSETLPCTSLAKHSITLKEDKIINVKSYRPEHHKIEINKQMTD